MPERQGTGVPVAELRAEAPISSTPFRAGPPSGVWSWTTSSVKRSWRRSVARSSRWPGRARGRRSRPTWPPGSCAGRRLSPRPGTAGRRSPSRRHDRRPVGRPDGRGARAVFDAPQVEPADDRAVVRDEHVVRALPGVLLHALIGLPVGEVLEVLVASVRDEPGEVRPVGQLESEDARCVVGAQPLELGHTSHSRSGARCRRRLPRMHWRRAGPESLMAMGGRLDLSPHACVAPASSGVP